MPRTIESLALPDVSSRYGAPMGRRGYGDPLACAPGTVHLFRMRMVDGDYDVGGAYWGAVRGESIYVAFALAGDADEGMRRTVRARSRHEAMARLGIPPNALRTGRGAAARALVRWHREPRTRPDALRESDIGAAIESAVLYAREHGIARQTRKAA